MKVKELIEVLKKMPSDAEVIITAESFDSDVNTALLNTEQNFVEIGPYKGNDNKKF